MVAGTPVTPAASNTMARLDRRAASANPAGDQPSGANMVPYMDDSAL